MFKLFHPVNIKFGEGLIGDLETLLERYEATNFVIVAGNSAKNNGILSVIESQLEGRVSGMIVGIEENPTIENVDSIIDLVSDTKADALIGIGGGSVMDATKVASIGAAMGLDASDVLVQKNRTRIPLILIPTTSGSSSEVTNSAVISDHSLGKKLPTNGPELFADLAIIDPELTYTCPKSVTAISGIDIMCHAFDAIGNVNHNPYSDALAIEALRLAFRHLKPVYDGEETREGRHALSVATMLVGQAFSQTGTSGSHAVSYYLTSEFGVPHGEACALTVDLWFKINSEEDSRLETITTSLGFSSVDEMLHTFNELKKAIGLRTTLGELGIDKKYLDAIAEDAMLQANMKNNIVQLNESELIELLNRK
ncbi:iron-containing alcohol dehydrogenase [Phocicoccus pinnipedialis]|uniref:Alcohol dehydrogenase 2 n=1 Tax=Phocicoccus pinnipedialis TaxID=110845 RepID=A0A6V7RAG4_9BACL|nr:iron-containing alcohol dehydrogenase [Jeotgalicoccus pinnipedialis]MBP1940193.1 alcohol dehydrogenase [Jeotgalicoccus pinnipedialis]CAD2073948.1 Alcohol dehydrogenase 2 [Jeotgalicoccus pinnipedialis]